MFRGPRDYSKVDLKQFGGHKDEVNCVAFSADFQIMVTGCDDERVRVFNTRTGDLVCKLKGHTGAVKSVSIAPNCKTFASGSYDKTVRIWQTNDGQSLHVLQGHTKSVEIVVYSSDSSKLCSGSWDRTAILWDVQNGYLLKVFEGHESLVQSIALSINGTLLVSHAWHGYPLWDFTIERKATGSWDYTVRLWTVTSPDGRDKVVVLRGHKGNIHAVVFSKEGMLASGSWDRTVKLWNPRTGKLIHTLMGHEGWVQALAFSSDGIYLASASDDDTVRVWDVVSGSCVKVLEVVKPGLSHRVGLTSNGSKMMKHGHVLPQEQAELQGLYAILKDRQI